MDKRKDLYHWVAGQFFVCMDHGIFHNRLRCPRSPLHKEKDIGQEDCAVAGPFPTREEAERWIHKLEVAQIEHELEAAE
jgi:hypothetical protein